MKGSSQYVPWRAGDLVPGWTAPPERFPEVSHVMCQELQFALSSSFLPLSVASASLGPLDGEGLWSHAQWLPLLFAPLLFISEASRNHLLFSQAPAEVRFLFSACCFISEASRNHLLFSQAPAEVRFLFSACTNGKATARGYFVLQPSQPLVHWAHSMSGWQRHRFDHASLMDCHCYITNSRSSAWTLSGLHSAV